MKLEEINKEALHLEIQNALLENRHVIITKHDGELVGVTVFDTKEELINLMVEEYLPEEVEYLTKKQAYFRTCNSAFDDVITELLDDIQMVNGATNGMDEEEESEYYKNLNLSYDYVTKDINKDDFVDGFYEHIELVCAINYPEQSGYGFKCRFNGDDNDIRLVTIEIL